MKVPEPEGVPRLDVSMEELERSWSRPGRNHCGKTAIKSCWGRSVRYTM
jgi:hypothetical protein